MLLVFLVKNKTLMTISSVALAGIAIAALIVTIFAIITSYNKSLYGAPGYLTFTLPVSGKAILGSKTIVSVCWMLISFIFAIAVGAFLVFYWAAQTSENFKSIIETVYSMLREMQGVPDVDTAIKSLVFIIVFLFIKAVFFIFKVSFSLTIANTKKLQKMNPIFGAILIYFAIYIIITICNVISTYIPLELIIASNGLGMSVNDVLYGLPADANVFLSLPLFGYIVEAVICVAVYVITGNIMSKHVNIK